MSRLARRPIAVLIIAVIAVTLGTLRLSVSGAAADDAKRSLEKRFLEIPQKDGATHYIDIKQISHIATYNFRQVTRRNG